MSAEPVGFVDEPQPRRRGRGLQLLALALACAAAWQLGVVIGGAVARVLLPT